jgi:hypothetical protein
MIVASESTVHTARRPKRYALTHAGLAAASSAGKLGRATVRTTIAAVAQSARRVYTAGTAPKDAAKRSIR